jgi:putative PIN family toxin of toxin-antitoxin system
MKITADTAILFRANAKARGPAREVLKLIKQRSELLILSQFILAEVERVLRYPRLQALYGLNDGDIAEHIQYLESSSEIVIPAEGPRIVRWDPDDDPIVYTAISGKAEVICTNDRHFYDPDVLGFCSRNGIRVMSDVDLLHALRSVT